MTIILYAYEWNEGITVHRSQPFEIDIPYPGGETAQRVLVAVQEAMAQVGKDRAAYEADRKKRGLPVERPQLVPHW